MLSRSVNTENSVDKGAGSMDIRYFELRAANKDCQEKFSEIAKQMYNGVPIFEHACDYVNNSASYKRTGRHLEIMEIGEYSIVVKLTSESKLEMASKSIAGFTRELLRVDQELYPDEADRLFRLFIYNSTLFRNTQLELGELTKKERRELSDVDALKKCVEIFCSGMTGSKEEAAVLANTKQKIKDILHEYEQFQRANSYAKKMRG